METIQHNLDKEEKLIELLGYNLVGPNGSNRWFILDENENQVGYIQYKKIHNANLKKGYSKSFGYHTFIDSSTVSCDFSREINDNTIDSINAYVLNIKRDNQEFERVEIDLGASKSLFIMSEKYGRISFSINDNEKRLYLFLNTKTDNFNVEEVLFYKNTDGEWSGNKEYSYQIKYCNKDINISDYMAKGKVIREIRGTQFSSNENKLRLSERTWNDDNLSSSSESIVEGTIDEMVIKHQMGIDCFNRFRFLINEIIPFNVDVLSLMVDEDMVKQFNLSVFFSDYDMSETKVQRELKGSKRISK